MVYQDFFLKSVIECEQAETYIGTGNPNSKILIVGKETATDIENKAKRDELYVRFQRESLPKFTKDADKSEIPNRKQFFKENNFFQNFPVIILACSNYINGSEIEEIFNVSFDKQCGNDKQLFWTHYNSDKTKLVIHTRQLSTNVSDDLLKEIANEIRDFTSKN